MPRKATAVAAVNVCVSQFVAPLLCRRCALPLVNPEGALLVLDASISAEQGSPELMELKFTAPVTLISGSAPTSVATAPVLSTPAHGIVATHILMPEKVLSHQLPTPGSPSAGSAPTFAAVASTYDLKPFACTSMSFFAIVAPQYDSPRAIHLVMRYFGSAPLIVGHDANAVFCACWPMKPKMAGAFVGPGLDG